MAVEIRFDLDGGCIRAGRPWQALRLLLVALLLTEVVYVARSACSQRRFAISGAGPSFCSRSFRDVLQ